MKHKVEIQYCTSWGYVDRAVSLAQKVLNEHKNNIEDLSIVPSTGGAFEIRVDGNLIFSKLKENRFPGLGEAESLIRNEVF